jgi:hypothetical protein
MEPGEAIVLELELDLVLDRKYEGIGQRYASVRGLNKKTKQKNTARQSRNHIRAEWVRRRHWVRGKR